MGDEEKELKFVQLFWESHAQRGRERWKKDDNGWTNEAQPYIDNAKAGNKNPDSMVILGNTVTYGQLLSSYAKYENIIMPYFRSVGAPPSTNAGNVAVDFTGYTFKGVHPQLISTDRNKLNTYYAGINWMTMTVANEALHKEPRWLGISTRTNEETPLGQTQRVYFANMPMIVRDGRIDLRVRAGGPLSFNEELLTGKSPSLYQNYILKSKGRVVEIDFCKEAARNLQQAFINIREVYGDNMIVAIPSLCYISCNHAGHDKHTKSGGISAHWNYRALDFNGANNPFSYRCWRYLQISKWLL